MTMTSKNGFDYNIKRYWYHISTTLDDQQVYLIPWTGKKAFNRPKSEPTTKRICVAPSIEQCLAALPYYLNSIISIYRTKNELVAKEPKKVFDCHITKEGWITNPTTFIKIGILSFQDIEDGLNIPHVIPQAASSGQNTYSGRVLKWWTNIEVEKFIKSP